MTGEIPYIDPKGNYPIGLAASLLLLSTQTLRRYVDLGYLHCRFNRINGRKVFKGSDLIALREDTI